MTHDGPARLPAWLRPVLATVASEPVERDHRQTDAQFHWRRRISVVTLVVGTTLLGWSLHVPPGDPLFYLASSLLAATWVVGALVSGPLHLGRARGHHGNRTVRPWFAALALGVAVVALFVVGGLVVRHLPLLRDPINDVLDHARFGSLPVVAVIALVNGAAEEFFFRGALFAAIGRTGPVVLSTAIYTLATITSGNAMLVFAALVLGLLVGAQRRVTGGILAPIITHLTWSVGMLFLLPLVLG